MSLRIRALGPKNWPVCGRCSIAAALIAMPPAATLIGAKRNDLAPDGECRTDFGRASSQCVARRIAHSAHRLGVIARLAPPEFWDSFCRLVRGIAERCGPACTGRVQQRECISRITGVLGTSAARDHDSRILGVFSVSHLGCRSERRNNPFGGWTVAAASVAPELYPDHDGRFRI